MIPYAAYLPILALSDYRLFGSIGDAIAGQHLDFYGNVKEKWVNGRLASKNERFIGMIPTNCGKEGEKV